MKSKGGGGPSPSTGPCWKWPFQPGTGSSSVVMVAVIVRPKRSADAVHCGERSLGDLHRSRQNLERKIIVLIKNMVTVKHLLS